MSDIDINIFLILAGVILAPLQGSSSVSGESEDCWRITNCDCVGHNWEGYGDNRQIVRIV